MNMARLEKINKKNNHLDISSFVSGPTLIYPDIELAGKLTTNIISMIIQLNKKNNHLIKNLLVTKKEMLVAIKTPIKTNNAGVNKALSYFSKKQ
jgi:hypothetical protein